MNFVRKILSAFLLVLLASHCLSGNALAQDQRLQTIDVVQRWYGLSLELVRHTPTYTPPVASRALAYLGITAYEVSAASGAMTSLASQLNGLEPLPKYDEGYTYVEAIVMQTALATVARSLFSNTGPTGQRVLGRLEVALSRQVVETVPLDISERSQALGKAIATHVIAWSQTDGGAVIENLGFPRSFDNAKNAAAWKPTNAVALQQMPLLPQWGNNRPFAMPSGAACKLAGPPEYSEDKTSEFYKQALEVVETKQALTAEQKAIARFWADDAMLSPTPPGHWISIALQIIERDKLDLNKSVDVLARLGISMADAFIGCWHGKYEYNLLRPLTYIRKVIDPKWESLINTPPFPEYPSGHSTQSGAAALVLTKFFGENFAFEDTTHIKDGIKGRSFRSFDNAAAEAGISRLYGGIHFRAAIDDGLEQGRCIGAYTNALRTRN